MTGANRNDEWDTLASLVDRLLDASPADRRAIVEELSAGNPARRAELEALLAECETESALLSAPAAERFSALFDDDFQFPAGLTDRYRVTSELGRGGMATVYLAHDLKHGRDVAVKVVHPSVAATLGAERFLREIEIAAQLHHPHIVPLYDSGESGGALYYVMPYEPGLSLRHRLSKDGPLKPEEVVVILHDVCDALAFAHGRGIVHRDIKPDNVLLSGRHALITDFGVAKAVAASRGADADGARGQPQLALTAAGSALGTPAYMAPEQIAGDPDVDHRADIYAVGVLAYELLAGQPPFAGSARQEILAAHFIETPDSLALHRTDIPAPLAALVMRCLEKKPADRWQSASEMVERLEALTTAAGGPMNVARRPKRWNRAAAIVLFVAAVGAAALVAWRSSRATAGWADRFARMHIEKFTDFPGSEVDAAISANGNFVVFLSDRDSTFDAFVSQVGSGQFLNLTGGRFDQLFNEEVHNIGLTPDAAHVWLRIADLTAPASVSLVPTMGGALRPFLPTAVMVAWSRDRARLAYHEAIPGDPIFVAGADGSAPRRIYIAPEGLHSHFVTWSPDGKYLYYSHGVPPDQMDIWRVSATGGTPERITTHDSRVAYPLLLDDRTLVYSATDGDGAGPWLYMMDVDKRVATRLSSGVERFVSIAASDVVAGQPRRLVATVSNPTVQLWSAPLGDTVADEASVTRVTLPTARSAAPRFARDGSLVYLASVGGLDGLWRMLATGANEVFKPAAGAVAGAAALSPDGTRMCFPVRREGRSRLRCTNADGSGVQSLADSLDVRGAPSWSPDGKWIAVAAREGEGARVFKVPVNGGAPVRLVSTFSSNPVWSPDGRLILYSGTPRGRSVPMNAVTPDGAPVVLPFPSLLVDRLGDSYRFLPDGRSLVVKLGGFRRQDFWSFDLTTGARRQLTRLKPGESVNRFDIAPDGRRIVFERVHENSDIALIELPDR